MLENWVLMTAFLIGSLLGLFHGCVLIFAPERYLPVSSYGESSLRLVQKAPFEFGKRLLGLAFSVIIVAIFVRPAVLWMLHPKLDVVSSETSPLPVGMARWDLLGVAIFAVIVGYLLLTRSEKAVELMFAADKARLQDKVTLRLWTVYVQLFGLVAMIWALLPAADFVKSLRS
jgi:hypothetical protein